MKILVFGNPFLEEDSLPLRILPRLRKEFPKIEFIEIDPSEGLEKFGKNLIILDSVLGIEKVEVINSIEQLETTKVCSMHDFDLGYNLKILKKLGMLESVKIIGVPGELDEQKCFEGVCGVLKDI